MKHVSLKTVEIVNPEGAKSQLNYALYIRTIVSTPGDPRQGGLSVEDIRRAIRVLDAMDRGNDKGFDLEDADYDFMCSKVRMAKFGFAHPEFVNFVESVTGKAQ